MTFVADLVRHTAERIRSERGIEVGLEKVVRDAEAAADPETETASVRRALKKRVLALEKAQTELLSLIKSVEHLKAILPFKEEGWPNQLKRFRELAVSDPTGAINAWLQYWFEAIGSHRLDASGRLAREAPLPPGIGLIQERAMIAAVGLERRDWNLAAPMLLAGAAGVRVDSDVVPALEVQASLRRLLVRLALINKRVDEADRLLQDGPGQEDTAAILALQARRHYLAGDEERAQSLLLEAQSANAGDLDVVVEQVRQGRKVMDVEAAVEIARIGIDTLPSLLDIDSDLDRLLEPPAELWIAVSDRARREAVPDLVTRALREAESLANWDEPELKAVIAERKAGVATSVTERLRALRDAGDQRLAAGDLNRARLDYSKAAKEAGDDVDAQLRASAAFRYADMVAVLDAPQPLRLVRDDLADALERLVEAQAVEGMAAAESWNYLTEVELRANLAREADPACADQVWRAFLAACRASALAPEETRRWSSLAGAADLLGCFRTAEAAARHAWKQGDPAAVPMYIQALANLGRIEQAIELISATDPWSECVRSYLLLRLGKHEDVVRLLRAVTIDPSWTWAQWTLVSALLLTGRFQEAAGEAEALASIASERIGEDDFLYTMASCEVILGRLDHAAELAKRLLVVRRGFREGDTLGLLAEVMLLRGDRDAGLRLFDQAVSWYRNRALDDWSRIGRPTLEALARWRGVDLGDLDGLERIVDRRREELAATSNPFTELAQAPAGTADPQVVKSARTLGAVLLHLAEGDEGRVREALATLGEGLEDEASSLHGHLRSLADKRRHAELATMAVQLASTGDRTAASDALSQLLDEVPYQTDDLLKEQGTGEVLKPVAEVLTELASNPRYSTSATNVLRWLDMAEPEPEAPPVVSLQLQLPSSWFADYTDPVQEHALFLRYLPELRARADWEIPGVNVVAEDDLEPDQYRIWANEELLDEGRVTPGDRYCTDDALEFLTTDIRSTATSDPGLALCRFPAAAVHERDGIADLLTMPAIEVVARLVGDAAKRLAERQTLDT